MSNIVSNLDEMISQYDQFVVEKSKAKLDKIIDESDIEKVSLDSQRIMEVEYFKEKLLEYVDHIV